MPFFQSTFDVEKARSFLGSRSPIIVEYVESIDSTNNEMKRRLEAGQDIRDGHVLIAEQQTAGRGRQGRTWFGRPGQSLTMSLVAYPKLAAANRSRLSLVTGLSICHALEDYLTAEPRIKWPNDIIVDDKKLGGILIEIPDIGDPPPVIVGIGLNLAIPRATFPTDFRYPATSAMHYWRSESIDREELFANIAQRIVTDYRELENGYWGSMRLAVIDRCWLLGKRVRVDGLEGRAHGIGMEGELRLVMDDGTREDVLSGDVELCES